MPTSPAFFPDDFPGEITLDHVIPGAAAEFAPLPQDMRPELAAALAARGIVSLYTHQADAYRAVRNGRHLVVVTPTASGQTLCYNLPVLQRLLEDPERRALYDYPTNALAQGELHTCRGVFGSQVANVMRLLMLICGFYGSGPTFEGELAWIANLLDLAKK